MPNQERLFVAKASSEVLDSDPATWGPFEVPIQLRDNARNKTGEIAVIRSVVWAVTSATPANLSANTLVCSLSLWNADPLADMQSALSPNKTTYISHPSVFAPWTLNTDIHTSGGVGPEQTYQVDFPEPGFFIGGSPWAFFNGYNTVFAMRATVFVYYVARVVSSELKGQVFRETVWSNPRRPLWST